MPPMPPMLKPEKKDIVNLKYASEESLTIKFIKQSRTFRKVWWRQYHKFNVIYKRRRLKTGVYKKENMSFRMLD